MTFTNVIWFALTYFLIHHASRTTARRLDHTGTLPFMHDIRLIHEQWMGRYGRVYKTAKEKETRLEQFKQNVELINSFNINVTSKNLYTLRVNEFADSTLEEIQVSHTGSRSRFGPFSKYRIEGSNVSVSSFDNGDENDITSSLDWRLKGAITPIKNQGHCGSCWAFATVAAIESINQIKTGNLISLSEQELLDCLYSPDDGGCNGGYMGDAFAFIAEGNGLPTEAEYPYKASSTGHCMMPLRNSDDTEVTISNFKYLPQPDDFIALKGALNSQPVAISIDASSHDFMFYGGGIFDGILDNDRVNHDLLLIGYGVDENGVDYWLLKNSWGTNWGEDGYMRLRIDENRCPIAAQAFIPMM